VDFFLDRQSERVLVNEINTMPGFTAASMFPRLWEASGFPLSRLLDRLIALALARHAARKSRRTSVRSASAPERRPEASAAPAGDPSA
jgi:D-alanine-D-alanine ligase